MEPAICDPLQAVIILVVLFYIISLPDYQSCLLINSFKVLNPLWMLSLGYQSVYQNFYLKPIPKLLSSIPPCSPSPMPTPKHVTLTPAPDLLP